MHAHANHQRSNPAWGGILAWLSLAMALLATGSAAAAAGARIYLPLIAGAPADRIAFTNTGRSQREISAIGPSGTGLLDITSTPGFESVAPAWSPAHTQLAFSSNREGLYSIYVINVDGSNMRRIALEIEAHDPAWSPDGQRIAFSSANGLYTVKLDGSGLTLIAPEGFSPAWSPDSTRIGYVVGIPDAGKIVISDADGTSPTMVPNTPGTIFTMAWSPDGARLAFASRSRNDVNIYSMQLDGANLKQLTNSPLYDYAPSWSPDGRQIVFTRRDPKIYTNDLYIINADGSGEHLLVKNGDEPSWAR